MKLNVLLADYNETENFIDMTNGIKFDEKKRLTHLNLIGFTIEEVPDDFLSTIDLSHLVVLNFYSHTLRSLSVDFMQRLHSLEYLDITLSKLRLIDPGWFRKDNSYYVNARKLNLDYLDTRLLDYDINLNLATSIVNGQKVRYGGDINSIYRSNESLFKRKNITI